MEMLNRVSIAGEGPFSGISYQRPDSERKDTEYKRLRFLYSASKNQFLCKQTQRSSRVARFFYCKPNFRKQLGRMKILIKYRTNCNNRLNLSICNLMKFIYITQFSIKNSVKILVTLLQCLFTKKPVIKKNAVFCTPCLLAKKRDLLFLNAASGPLTFQNPWKIRSKKKPDL